MIRVLSFFALLFVLALGFAWMADLPGVISISWEGYVWEQPPVVVAVVGAVLLAIFLAVVWVVRVVMNSPRIASRFVQRRRKDKGYQALSHGLIALGTGNAKLARRYALDAEKLLPDEAASRLLLAQTAQLAGKDEEARGRFEAMLDDPQTRALGLHGLFVEAERQGEPVAARHYAEEAAREMPGLEWAGKAVLGYQAVAGDWETALKSLERNYTSKLIDKKSYRRQRAVLLTASATALEDQDPERAFAQAKEAHGLSPALVPAAVLASRLATRRGDIRKASKLIEATWRLSPHPDLAETYAHVRTGDSAVDRLKRVKSLAGHPSTTPVGALAVARAAMEAREFTEARAQLKSVLTSNPSRAAFLMMAELEELEHGDQGRMRDWLARAVHAPLDKAWVADGIVSNEWRAVSPVTGRLDAFEWALPPSAPDPAEALTLDEGLFDAPVAAKPAKVIATAESAAETPAPAQPSMTEDVTPGVQDPAKSETPPEAPKTGQMAGAGQSGAEAAADQEEPSHVKADVASGPAHQDKASKPEAEAPARTVRTGVEGTVDDVGKTPPISALPDRPDAGLLSSTAAAASAAAGAQAATPMPAVAEGSAGHSPQASASDELKPGATASAPPASNGQPASAAGDPEDGADKPIAFALGRMPDDPGPEDEAKAAQQSRSKFFN